jgi:hypothetical protein
MSEIGTGLQNATGIRNGMARAGYAFVEASDMRNALARFGTLADWPQFAESWNDLEVDTYMADGGRYRKRRHAAFGAHADEPVHRKPEQPHYLVLLADCHERSGDAEAGLRVISEAFQAMEATGERLWEPELHRTKGQLMLLAGAGPTVAENCFRQALTAARNQEARLFELRTATKLAILLAQCGRRSEAINILLPVHGWFAEGFDNADIKEAKALLDCLL